MQCISVQHHVQQIVVILHPCSAVLLHNSDTQKQACLVTT